MSLPPLPIDFAAIAAYGAVMMGQVAAGVAGVVTLQSLIKAGFRYVERSFTVIDVQADSVDVVDVDAEGIAQSRCDDGYYCVIMDDGRRFVHHDGFEYDDEGNEIQIYNKPYWGQVK